MNTTWSYGNYDINLLSIALFHSLGFLLVMLLDNVFSLPNFIGAASIVYERVICKLNMFARNQGF